MDFVSHILIGRALAVFPKNSRKNIYLITFFSFLPDLPQVATYLYLGFVKARPFLIPLSADWQGFRQFHPIWSVLWEIPHNVFFALLIIIPIILFFKLPKMAFIAYLSHIFVDLFTHAGEWGMKPLYPLPYQVNGFTNAWAWPFWGMFFSWLVLFMIIAALHLLCRRHSS